MELVIHTVNNILCCIIISGHPQYSREQQAVVIWNWHSLSFIFILLLSPTQKIIQACWNSTCISKHWFLVSKKCLCLGNGKNYSANGYTLYNSLKWYVLLNMWAHTLLVFIPFSTLSNHEDRIFKLKNTIVVLNT